MDVAHGPSPVHNGGPGPGISAGATSPPTPPRPAIPPKPDKDKVGVKTQRSLSSGPCSPVDGHVITIQPGSGSGAASVAPNFRSPISTSSSNSSPKSPPTPVLTPPTPASGDNSPGNRPKPALPPKPPSSSLHTSPPAGKFPLKAPPKFPVTNANAVNNNVRNSPPAPTAALNGEHNGNGTSNGHILSPPLPFLRAKPPQSPGDPLSPRPFLAPRSPNSRPNSFFNFASPPQNLNSSTSGGLNQSGAGGAPPPKLAPIRAKSASLGRNITPPTSFTSGGGGIGGIFSRKSSTLSKFLPLDLHIGSRGPPPQPPTKPAKSFTLNLNPFIQQQKEQQQQMSQKVQPGQAIQNLGRSISFSPESPIPPPPPPRQRKKLSPVNSIGSPTSPTSASPIHSSLSPTSPLPVPPPISPAMNPVAEAAEEGKGAIYAEVDKERKWAERKLREQQIQSVSSQNSNKTSVSGYSDIDNYEKVGGPPKPEAKDESNVVKGECAVVNSWLGKYLQKPVTTEASSARAPSPTYQSANTGHIYETIGREQNGITSPDACIDKGDPLVKDAVEIQESSEVVVEDDLSVNQSFLFKLVISHKKVEESAKSLEEPESVQSTVDTTSSPPPPQPLSAKIEEVVASPSDAILIPTVVQDLTEETSPQTESNPKETESVQKDEATPTSPSTRDDGAAFTSQSSVNTDSTIASTETPSRSNSILRRRSWNCDRVASPSLSESSSSTTSSNLPYHMRDRSYTCHDKKGFLQDEWIDEGDLSHGVLADAESSDNLPLRSSAEDIAQLRGISIPGGGSTLSKASFASRRSRFVDSIFSSFGKGSSSSSGGGYAARPRPVTQNMRHANGGNKRPKEKARSHQFPSDPLKGIHPDIKFGRQVSDSIMSTTTMISGPILPSPAVQSLADSESGILVHKPQSVQFSAEVAETRIIYPAQNYSSEEGDGNNNALCQDEQNLIEPITPVGGGGEEETITRGGDNESVSSSESASGSGSLSGYEDILAELSPKEKKSFYVAREILTSERTFVEVLNLLTIDFPRYLHNTSKYHGTHILSKEDLDMILGGLPNLKRVNENLLTDLEERICRWRESPKIADILVKKGPFLKLYATYIKDFQKNSKHLDTCCQRHPLFAATVKEFELSERCQKLGLKHYMLKPVQRMPQYRLLLEDYLKSLEEENEDYQDTLKGITIVKDVAEHANEAIRLQVNTDKLHHLQNRLAGGTIIMESNRQLLKEGELRKVCRKVLQPRFFVLMNDCVLCCTYYAGAGAPKDLKLRYELPLAGMRVLLSPAEDYQFEFTVISVARSFNLVANTAREREDWMKALDNAIHDNIKKRTCSTPDQEIGFQIGKEAPVWIQDSRVTMCQQCTAEFTITFRRHHCRACGKVVCGNCSGNEAPLPYLKNASARVCDSCYEYLLEEFDNLGGLATDETDTSRGSIREKFKKVTPNVSKRANKIKRSVPARLEVHANSSGSRISGYLHWREREKKSWKRRWFVLIDRVLYIYAASEDIVAIKSIPLLGWQVELDKSEQPQESEENHAVFRLTHLGHTPIHFQADNLATAEKWVAAMNEVVVL